MACASGVGCLDVIGSCRCPYYLFHQKLTTRGYQEAPGRSTSERLPGTWTAVSHGTAMRPPKLARLCSHSATRTAAAGSRGNRKGSLSRNVEVSEMAWTDAVGAPRICWASLCLRSRPTSAPVTAFHVAPKQRSASSRSSLGFPATFNKQPRSFCNSCQRLQF